jgi:hypothetical protein
MVKIFFSEKVFTISESVAVSTTHGLSTNTPITDAAKVKINFIRYE